MKEARNIIERTFVFCGVLFAASLLHASLGTAASPDAERLAVYRTLKIQTASHIAAFKRCSKIKLQHSIMENTCGKRAVSLQSSMAPQFYSFSPAELILLDSVSEVPTGNGVVSLKAVKHSSVLPNASVARSSIHMPEGVKMSSKSSVPAITIVCRSATMHSGGAAGPVSLHMPVAYGGDVLAGIDSARIVSMEAVSFNFILPSEGEGQISIHMPATDDELSRHGASQVKLTCLSVDYSVGKIPAFTDLKCVSDRENADLTQMIFAAIRQEAKSWKPGSYEEPGALDLAWLMQSDPFSKDSFRIYEWLLSLSPDDKDLASFDLDTWAESHKESLHLSLLEYYYGLMLLAEDRAKDAMDVLLAVGNGADVYAARAQALAAVAAVRMGNLAEMNEILSELSRKWPKSEINAEGDLLRAWVHVRSAGARAARNDLQKLAEKWPETEAAAKAREMLAICDAGSGDALRAPSAAPDLGLVSRYDVHDGAGNVCLWEVYVENRSDVPVTFETVCLNGIQTAVKSSSSLGLLENWTWAMMYEDRNPGKALYHQFYPSATAPPGETIVLRTCLAPIPPKTVRWDLSLKDVWGHEYTVKEGVGMTAAHRERKPLVRSISIGGVSHPLTAAAAMADRALVPKKRIVAVSYESDYSRMFVQYHSGGDVLNRVFINNQLATGCVKLRVDNPARPSVVCFDPKREIKAGDPIHITLVFEQSSRCDALVRAVAGPIFHGWRDVRTSEAAALGLDLSPSIQMGQWYDVTAKSSIYGEKDLVEIIDKERRLFADSEPSTLYSVGLSPLGGERDRQLYAPLSDAVHILTLSLFPGFREDWTLDRDLRSLGDTISSLGGKPWVYSWDPQAIREHFGDDSYVEMMGWLALVSGAKGLNYVSPGLSGRDPRYAESFRSRAGLADLIAGLNASLRGHGDILAPLLPMGSDEIKGLPTVKAYTAWAGDRGVVTVLANLSEDTYSAPQGTIPDFVAPVRIPLGYAATHAVDLLTGENVNVSHDGDRFSLKVDSIQTHRVFWIDLAKN